MGTQTELALGVVSGSEDGGLCYKQGMAASGSNCGDNERLQMRYELGHRGVRSRSECELAVGVRSGSVDRSGVGDEDAVVVSGGDA
jgi:hypothetical protein